MKSIREVLNSLFNNQNGEKSSLILTPVFDGLGLEFSDQEYTDLAKGKGDDLGLHQFIAMNSILEQGIGNAEKIPTGVFMPSENAVRLEKDLHRLFDFPPPWPGGFLVEQTGLTYNTDFSLKLNLIKENGEIQRTFDRKGPVLF